MSFENFFWAKTSVYCIVPKGQKDIFRFSFFPRTIIEWNKLLEETVSSQSFCISSLIFIRSLAFTVVLYILL